MQTFMLAALLAGFVAAAPNQVSHAIYAHVETRTQLTTVYSTSTAAPTPINLVPVPHPEVDPKSYDNLKATKDALLRFAESQDDVDQQVATISSQDTENALVQLEHTSYIKDLACTDTSATITFSDKGAYDVAASDWKSHTQFVLVSYDEKCGPQHDASKRDYMLAKSITADPKTLTIKASVAFVDRYTAFGKEATLKVSVKPYRSTQPEKRCGVFSDCNNSGNVSFPWNEYPTNEMTDSYGWGSGYQFYGDDSTKIACVGCGTDGEVTVSAEAVWRVGNIKTATVTLQGHMKATVALGVEASIAAKIPIANLTIADIPLSPLNIGEWATLGPKILIKAAAKIDLDGHGGLIAGATLDWPNMTAVGDYENESATADGFTPTVQGIHSLNGTLRAALDLSLPIGVGIGVDIIDVISKDLMVWDTPGVQLGASISDQEPCQGVGMDVDLYNNVGLDVFGIKSVPFSAFDYTTTVFSTCFSTATSSAAVASSTNGTVVSATSVAVTSTPVVGTGPSSGFVTLPAPTSAPFGNGTSAVPPSPTGGSAVTSFASATGIPSIMRY